MNYLKENNITCVEATHDGSDALSFADQVMVIKDGQILVKVLYLSFDPTQRGWLNDVKSYVPPVQIGEIMRASSVGQIIETKDDNFSIGLVGSFLLENIPM